ncbi:hypothetical protein [Halorussus halobius]|uniref:hypothetical protein n=1 Tax=Halorussus halobius TaxID=1710537 RepID=UPI00109234BB|nr:hypothetical protein [Halorussus halobius]
MPQTARKLETVDGTEVTVEPIRRLSDGESRIDIESEDGRKWRLDVTRAGEFEVVASWNVAGELADVERPDWVENIVARLQRA